MRTVWTAVIVSIALLACGQTIDAAGPQSRGAIDEPGEPAADADAMPDAATDACSVSVRATNYDAHCAADDDCVAVPRGGDACDPCSAGSGDWSCKLTTINTKGLAVYRAALDGVAQRWAGTAVESQCIVQSCPVFSTMPRCRSGVCTVD